MTLSETLQVTIEELVAAPRPDIRHYRGDELQTKVRGGVTVRKLLPDPIPGLEFERLELPRGKTMVGVPHTPGTREYLTCESGRVELVVGGETYPVLPGEVVSFRGDQKHSYRNGADGTTVAYSAVLVSPSTR